MTPNPWFVMLFQFWKNRRTTPVHRSVGPQSTNTMRHFRAFAHALLITLTLATSAQARDGPAVELAQSRIGTIEAQLDAKPGGLGPTCDDRQWWSAASVQARSAAIRDAANTLLQQPFPAWDQEAYLEFSRTGARPQGERMMNARNAWLYPLVIGECVEGKGRFLPAIANTLTEIARQPTWTWPAHDRTLHNVRDHNYEVDLLAADMAHELAQALYMLGDRISNEVRAAVLDAMNDRIFNPLRKSLLSGINNHWWLRTNNNWNAVCLKGSVGAALAVLEDRHDRALFVAAAEQFIRNYVSGFTEDGYTPEGPGYWNYGFSHFTQLRELLSVATHGRIDLFNDPKVQTMAMYGYRIEMLPNNIAAFGDASPKTRMDELTRAYANKVFQFGFSQRLSSVPLPTPIAPYDAPLFRAVLALRDQPAALGAGTTMASVKDGRQTYFASVGVLVSRPGPDDKLGVTIKAGGNGNHSHNDIGSYTIGLGQEQPVGDVGAPVYSVKTFSKDRYAIPSISSWGHPVPVVDSALQVEADTRSPGVLSTSFSETRDEITINLADAYVQQNLKSLTRTLVHIRGHGGHITITDRFEYHKSGAFEVALTTLGHWKHNDDGSIDLWQNTEYLRITIDASAPWELQADTSTAEGLTFTRLSLRLKDSTTHGFISASYAPRDPASPPR